jgi:DUF971 family protein
MTLAPQAPWPIEIRFLTAQRILEVEFDNGRTFQIPAELARVESPSAEVQGHGVNGKRIVGGKSKIGIRAIEPVGRYAVKITFDDGHDTGLFTWTYLYELGQNRDRLWTDYLSALKQSGLSRDA